MTCESCGSRKSRLYITSNGVQADTIQDYPSRPSRRVITPRSASVSSPLRALMVHELGDGVPRWQDMYHIYTVGCATIMYHPHAFVSVVYGLQGLTPFGDARPTAKTKLPGRVRIITSNSWVTLRLVLFDFPLRLTTSTT